MASILDVERNFGTNSVISTPFGRVCCFLNVVRLLFGFYSDCLALSGWRLAAISVLFLEFGRDVAAVLVIWEVFGRDWDVMWLLFRRDSSCLTTSGCYVDIC